MKPPACGIDLIKRFEGCHLKAYPDPLSGGKPYTVGWGSTKKMDGSSFILGETIVDFGCGKGNLLEVLYRNRFRCKKFIGIDIRKQTIDKANEKYNIVDWAEFLCMDLVKEDLVFQNFQADKVCSFEVAEHVGRQNIDLFLQNFKACGNSTATYYRMKL